MSQLISIVLALGLIGNAEPPKSSSVAADTVRHVLFIQGTEAGHQLVWRDADGALRAHFEFNDRGRGPFHGPSRIRRYGCVRVPARHHPRGHAGLPPARTT